jgi:hypothetical protein
MALRRRPDYPPEIVIGIDYADRVATGRTPAGKWAVLASQRFRADLARAEARRGPMGL